MVVAVRTWVRGAMGRDPRVGRMWQCGESVYEPRKLAPGCLFTSRDLCIEAMDDRLLHHCIHTGADVAGPAPGEPCVGRGDPWAKPEAIVEPLPLPIRSRRDDHRRGSHILNQYQGGMCISGS